MRDPHETAVVLLVAALFGLSLVSYLIGSVQ